MWSSALPRRLWERRGLMFPSFRVVWVHSGMGEVDNRVCHIKTSASVDQGAGAGVALALASAAVDRRATQANWGPQALVLVDSTRVAARRGQLTSVIGTIFGFGENSFSTELITWLLEASVPTSTMRCRTPPTSQRCRRGIRSEKPPQH